MSNRRFQISIFGLALWVSSCCVVVALRFEPRWPFLLTMFCVGIAIAWRERPVCLGWSAMRACFLAGLLLGPPLFVAGLYVRQLDWPLPPNTPRSLTQLYELGSAIVAGAWLGSLAASVGGFAVACARIVRHRLPLASSTSLTRHRFAHILIAVVYLLPLGAISVWSWQANAEERLVLELEKCDLKAIPTYAESKLDSSIPKWCDWWFRDVRIPDSYWVITDGPFSNRQSLTIQKLINSDKLNALNINCRHSSSDQLSLIVEQLEQLQFDGVVTLDFEKSQNTMNQLRHLDQVELSIGLNLAGSDIGDNTLLSLRRIPNLISIDLANCKLSERAKLELASAHPRLLGLFNRP